MCSSDLTGEQAFALYREIQRLPGGDGTTGLAKGHGLRAPFWAPNCTRVQHVRAMRVCRHPEGSGADFARRLARSLCGQSNFAARLALPNVARRRNKGVPPRLRGQRCLAQRPGKLPPTDGLPMASIRLRARQRALEPKWWGVPGCSLGSQDNRAWGAPPRVIGYYFFFRELR